MNSLNKTEAAIFTLLLHYLLPEDHFTRICYHKIDQDEMPQTQALHSIRAVFDIPAIFGDLAEEEIEKEDFPSLNQYFMYSICQIDDKMTYHCKSLII